MKVSVVMASYLFEFEGSAKNREQKFVRAVDSFLNNTYNNKELIIVSDGCSRTEMLYNEKYNQYHEIKLVSIEKQPLFSGNVRQTGIEKASGVVILYLDSDDYIGKNHISVIAKAFKYENPDWAYFSDILRLSETKTFIRPVSLDYSCIGTSNVAHRNKPEFSWHGCDNFGHDWLFIKHKLMQSKNYIRIYGADYEVRHSTGHDFS